MDPVNVTAEFEVGSFTRSWDNSGHFKTLGSPWIRRSRSFKVVDFGTNQKRVCDFLLVRHRTLVLSCTLSEILLVFVLLSYPTPIPPQFRWCPRCTRWPVLGVARAEALGYSAVKLLSVPLL